MSWGDRSNRKLLCPGTVLYGPLEWGGAELKDGVKGLQTSNSPAGPIGDVLLYLHMPAGPRPQNHQFCLRGVETEGNY